MWSMILVLIGVVVAGLALFLPNASVQKVSLMVNILTIVLLLFTIWVAIPGLFRDTMFVTGGTQAPHTFDIQHQSELPIL